MRTQERFRAAGAFLRGKPDDRWPERTGGGFGDAEAEAGRQPEGRRDAGTELEKVPSVEAAKSAAIAVEIAERKRRAARLATGHPPSSQLFSILIIGRI